MEQKSLKICISHLAAAVLSLAVVFSLCAPTALAYTTIQTDQAGSLTISYVDTSTGAAISDVSLSLYRVADVTASVRYTLTGAFEDASVELNGVTSAGTWRELASTLASYAAAQSVSPDRTGTTDSGGHLTFSGLSTGLYLLAGSQKTQGGYVYTPTAVLIQLPTLNEAENIWDYTPTAEIKFERTPESSDRPVDVTVKKVWSGDDGESRPDSVTVQLLKNGAVYRTVTLNEANNWTYTWTNLSSGSRWQISEREVPDGYTVLISSSGYTFTVKNTYTPDAPEPDPPDNPDTPDHPDTPDRPDTPDNPNTPDGPDTPDSPDLPQTGQLNWPVPVLAVFGLVLLSAGWYLRFEKKRDDHAE